jgi:hypothetical protein
MTRVHSGGGAIKLSDNAEVATGLTVGEGVETVLVSMALPTWCRREKLAPPRWPQPVAESHPRCKVH